jgi:hypothetical protein
MAWPRGTLRCISRLDGIVVLLWDGNPHVDFRKIGNASVCGWSVRVHGGSVGCGSFELNNKFTVGIYLGLASDKLVTDSSDGFAVNAFGIVSGGIVSGGMESKLSDTFGV